MKTESGRGRRHDKEKKKKRKMGKKVTREKEEAGLVV